MEVHWTGPALRMLNQRDRFTQQAITQEFETIMANEPPLGRAIPFDSEQHGYLTTVADARYSVLWYLENGAAVVRAVVPWTRFSRETPNLKTRVQDIVRQESRGAVEVK